MLGADDGLVVGNCVEVVGALEDVGVSVGTLVGDVLGLALGLEDGVAVEMVG